MAKKKKMKISEKDMKALRKKAWKDIENSGVIISKFKTIFGVFDADNEDIVKLLKKAIKSYLKDHNPDPEEQDFDNFIRNRIHSGKNTTAFEEDDGTVVVRVNKGSKKKSKYDKLFA